MSCIRLFVLNYQKFKMSIVNQYFQTKFLNQFLDEVMVGHIQIPSVIHDVKWTPQQNLELFKSIGQNLPIGSFLLLKTIKQIECNSFKNSVKHVDNFFYLLDGYQRLFVLFQELKSSFYESHICFDLDCENFTIKNQNKKYQMPVYLLFNCLDLIKYQRTLKSDELIQKSDAISTIFRNFKIPLSVVETDNEKLANLAYCNSGTRIQNLF